jgi:transposase-like protein
MFENADIELSCPGCKHKMTKTLGWITSHNQFVCTGCNQTITLETDQLARDLKKVDKILDSFPKEITIRL